MPSYRTHEIRIASGNERPYSADEWRDALVIVRKGALELVTVGGVRRRFGLGSVLFLANLRLRSLRNPGGPTTVLTTLTRPTSGLTRPG